MFLKNKSKGLARTSPKIYMTKDLEKFIEELKTIRQSYLRKYICEADYWKFVDALIKRFTKE